MVAIQGHITNSRGNYNSTVAHREMEARIRTWTGGFSLTVRKDDTFSLSFGPHGGVGSFLLLEGKLTEDGRDLDITFMSSLLRSLAGSGE